MAHGMEKQNYTLLNLLAKFKQLTYKNNFINTTTSTATLKYEPAQLAINLQQYTVG